MLRVEDINVYYGAIHAIKGISLQVPAGEIVALIGSNGAGKSTTLHTISGLLKPKTGKIYYQDQDIVGIPAHKLVGIIAEKDIFRSFVEIMSMNRPCTRITFDVTDKVGVIADISHIFKEAGVNIISIVSRQIDEATGKAEVVVRANMTRGGMEVVEILRQAGYDITDIMTYEGID